MYGCDLAVLETAAHIILDCPIAALAWSPALNHWFGVSGLRWQLSAHLAAFGRPAGFAPSAATRPLLPKWDRLHACTVHALWAARCRSVIDGDPPPAGAALWADIQCKVARG